MLADTHGVLTTHVERRERALNKRSDFKQKRKAPNALFSYS